MVAEERVIVEVEVKTDIKDLLLLEKRFAALEERYRRLDRESRNVERSTERVDRSLNRLNRTTRTLGRTFLSFFKILGKFSFIAMAANVGILSTALLGAKLAMATGRVAAQAYRFTLQGVAAAAAGVASAVALAAAAVRQFSEAQLAPFVGGGTNAARVLRGVDAQVSGLLGREDTAALAGQLGKAGLSAQQTSGALRELFNITAGNTSGISSIGKSLAGDAAGIVSAFEGIGPQGMAIAKSIEGVSREGIIEQLASGQLTPDAFKGFSDSLSSTLIGSLKVEINSLFNVFANLGSVMLEPFRGAFEQMGDIIRSFVINTSPVLRQFGAETFAPSLVSATQWIADFFQKVLTENLPKLEGFGERFADAMRDVRDFFRDIADRMRPLEAGAEVLMDFFGEVFGGFFGGGVLASFNENLVKNADAMREFGSSIGNVISAIGRAFGGDNMARTITVLTEAFNRFAADVVPDLITISQAMFDLALTAIPTLITALDAFVSIAAPIAELLAGVLGGMGDAGGLAALGLLAGGRALTRGRGRGRQQQGGGGPGLLAMAAGGLFGVGGERGQGMSRGQRLARGARGGVALAGGMLALNGISGAFQGDMGIGTVGQGVAGGAMIGGMVGGPVGAVVGGALGGAITLGIGWWQKKKREDNARELADEVINGWLDETTQLMGTELPNAVAQIDELLRDDDRLKEMAEQRQADVGKFRDELQERRVELVIREAEVVTTLNANMEMLQTAMGVTAERVAFLANEFNISLSDTALTAQEFGMFMATQFPDNIMGMNLANAAVHDTTLAREERMLGAQTEIDAFINRALGGAQITAADLDAFVTAVGVMGTELDLEPAVAALDAVGRLEEAGLATLAADLGSALDAQMLAQVDPEQQAQFEDLEGRALLERIAIASEAMQSLAQEGYTLGQALDTDQPRRFRSTAELNRQLSAESMARNATSIRFGNVTATTGTINLSSILSPDIVAQIGTIADERDALLLERVRSAVVGGSQSSGGRGGRFIM